MIIYLHKSCFDGVVSAAAAATLLDLTMGKTADGIEPVDYAVKKSWTKTFLSRDACVVDFLYHPMAEFWWDHHSTTFDSDEMLKNFEEKKSAYIKFDPSARSCAGLILESAINLSVDLSPTMLEAIHWADIIDSASYSSPDEAVLHQPIARKIALSFAEDSSSEYHDSLLRNIQLRSLAEIGEMEPFRTAIFRAQSRYSMGLSLMSSSIVSRLGIACYDLAVSTEIIDRMMPYLIDPTARYSLGLIRRKGLINVTCNANPWHIENSVDLASIFKKFGGGGHRDVGSVLFSESESELARKTWDIVFSLLSKANISKA
jgi:hypothetical protein